MNLLLDSFWRAAAYCLRPRVIALSLLPLAIMVVLALVLGYFFWAPAIDWVRSLLESSQMLGAVFEGLQKAGLGQLKTVIAPLIVIFALTPVIVVVALLVVAAMMGPSLTALVAELRFPALEKKGGFCFVCSVGWSLASTAMALVAFVISVPLWLVPPLVLVLPPLIWGWLTYRVMAYDALSDHATSDERRVVFKRHRMSLLAIGVVAGFMGAIPGFLWVVGGLATVLFFVFLVPVAIWIYTLVFAFAALWFAHFCLAALADLRREEALRSVDDVPPAP